MTWSKFNVYVKVGVVHPDRTCVKFDDSMFVKVRVLCKPGPHDISTVDAESVIFSSFIFNKLFRSRVALPNTNKIH